MYDSYDEYRYRLYDEPDSNKLHYLFEKNSELIKRMNLVANKFLKWSLAKDRFISETIKFQSELTSQLNMKLISVDEAIIALQKEITALEQQDELISKKNVKQAIIVKPEMTDIGLEQQYRNNLIIAGIGFIAGGLQFVTGATIVSTGIGIAPGALMIAHGVNNIVENGYYLLYRESYTGPVRFVYQGVGDLLGISKHNADLIYTITDVGMSFQMLYGYKLAEDTARLYRHINMDLITGLKKQGISSISTTELSVEIVGDLNTLYAQMRSE
ncbi:DUF4225 domain-containing protein [Enterobacter sp.]|uniref:DUF4225 domain-containing protein n=1 Tax=Enterobacter sp. TaxID=42895 RepID=UPI00296F2465|nr:DUF4225 domain-containing protein [Enterobacter sp.]